MPGPFSRLRHWYLSHQAAYTRHAMPEAVKGARITPSVALVED